MGKDGEALNEAGSRPEGKKLVDRTKRRRVNNFSLDLRSFRVQGG